MIFDLKKWKASDIYLILDSQSFWLQRLLIWLETKVCTVTGSLEAEFDMCNCKLHCGNRALWNRQLGSFEWLLQEQYN